MPSHVKGTMNREAGVDIKQFSALFKFTLLFFTQCNTFFDNALSFIRLLNLTLGLTFPALNW